MGLNRTWKTAEGQVLWRTRNVKAGEAGIGGDAPKRKFIA
jgi:hypothetical protein